MITIKLVQDGTNYNVKRGWKTVAEREVFVKADIIKNGKYVGRIQVNAVENEEYITDKDVVAFLYHAMTVYNAVVLNSETEEPILIE